MIYLLATSLACNLLLVGGFLWFLAFERENQRAERQSDAQERDDTRKAMLLLVDHVADQRRQLATEARLERERSQAEAFRERQIAYERIQRPDQIPAQAAPEPSPELLSIPVDDDEAFWEHRGVNANAG